MALSVNTTITRMMDEPDYPVIVHAKQNDKRTRFVTLRCSDTENGFSIPSGTVGIVRVRKNWASPGPRPTTDTRLRFIGFPSPIRGKGAHGSGKGHAGMRIFGQQQRAAGSQHGGALTDVIHTRYSLHRNLL